MTSQEPRTVREYLRGRALATSYAPLTLATVAARVADGEDFFFAVREFLDDLGWADLPAQRARLIVDPPQALADPRHDAFLAGLAEHVAVTSSLDPPAWSRQPQRFLDTWWFPAEERAFLPMALVESPAAFRRRGVFIAASLLSRV
jgi:hypothetical protein